MQVRYYPGEVGAKAVAKTEAVGLNSNSGSTNQVSTMSVLGLAAVVINSTVDKVGWYTGWTRGLVKDTCLDIYPVIGDPSQPLSTSIDGQHYIGLKCTLRVEGMNLLPGDSGGPLFFAMGNPATQAAAVGIVIATNAQAQNWCNSPCNAFATPWNRIEAVLQMPYGGGLTPY